MFTKLIYLAVALLAYALLKEYMTDQVDALTAQFDAVLNSSRY